MIFVKRVCWNSCFNTWRIEAKRCLHECENYFIYADFLLPKIFEHYEKNNNNVDNILLGKKQH